MTTATGTTGQRARRGKDPFAALPHHIAGDPRISPLGKAVLLALLYWARDQDRCWPADRSIGQRIGRSEATVQRALRHLQGLGLIDRQKTDANRTGRVIRLLWRVGISEGPSQSGMTGRSVATMRDERDVIVRRDAGNEISEPPTERPRPESPDPVASLVPSQPLAVVLTQALGPRADPIVREAPIRMEPPGPARAPAGPPPGSGPALRSTEGERPRSPTGEARATPDPPPRSTTRPIPLASSAWVSPSAPSAVVEPRRLVGLTPPEQARLWELPEATQQRVLQWLALGDRICLGEAKRLLRPPRPPEPPPQSLSTIDLFVGLPGRPDRIAAAAGRLAEELKDPASYGYYLALAEAVCSRRHPAEALLKAWKEGRSEKARRPAAVFTTAWKRATRPAG